MRPKVILVRADAFHKLAKEPYFEPEEADIDIDFDPGGHYDHGSMEGLMTSDVGSNYGYLTPPLPNFRDEEITTFDTAATNLYDEYKPNIDRLRRQVKSIGISNTAFNNRAKTALEHIIDNINAFDTYVDQPEIVVAKLQENIRQAKYINKALSDLIEHNRAQSMDIAVSMLARCANSTIVLGINILKRLNKLLSSSRIKKQSPYNYDFDK